jgi:hypothetical protein
VSVKRLFLVLWILLALRAVATLAPTSWLWGVDSLADRSLVLRVLGLVLLAAAAAPAIGKRVFRAVRGVMRRLSSRVLAVAASLPFVLLLAWMRSNNILLGDSQTWLSALEKGVRSAGGAHREPLPQAAVIAFHRLVAGPAGWDSHATFTAVGIALGLGFLAVSGSLARALAKEEPGRVLVFSLIVLGGGLQLFAGYPEFYGFALAAVLLFARLGIRSIEGRGGALPACLAFVLAGLCHAQVAFAFPAVVYILVRAWKAGRKREAILALVSIPVATVLALVALRYPFGEIGKEAARVGALLPPLGGATTRTAYGIFTPVHLVDLLNALLLVSPLLPVAIALGLADGTPVRPRRIFLGCLAVGPILFALAANPELGMARDWDIFVLPFALLTLWMAEPAAAAIDRAAGKRRTPPEGRSPHGFARGRFTPEALAGAVFLACLLHSFLWIDANHRPDPALERMRRVAANPALFGPRSLGETWRYIGSVDMMAGRTDPAARSYLLAIQSDPDEKMSYRFLAGNRIDAAREAGRDEREGLADYHARLETGKQRPAYGFLGGTLACLTVDRLDLALLEARQMVVAEPTHPELLAVSGDLLRVAGETERSRVAYESALARDPAQPRARVGMACLAGIRGDRTEVEAQIREALRRTPWSPLAQQFARQVAGRGDVPPSFFQTYFFLQ